MDRLTPGMPNRVPCAIFDMLAVSRREVSPEADEMRGYLAGRTTDRRPIYPHLPPWSGPAQKRARAYMVGFGRGRREKFLDNDCRIPERKDFAFIPVGVGAGGDVEFQYLAERNTKAILSVFSLTPEEVKSCS